MRVLVTGGAGFIGSHIVEALTECGHEPVVLDALLPSAHRELPPTAPLDAEWLHGDVRDRAVVERALYGVDAVCHQAAMVGLGKDFADAPDYVGCNDLGTAVLLAAMAERGVRKLVLAGSMVVYGEGRYDCPRHGEVRPGPRAAADLEQGRFEPACPRCGVALRPGLVGEDAPADPRNVYAATKLTQEHLAAAWVRSTGGSAVSLRYHNVYGPGMPRDTPYAGVASFFRSALERGEPPRVFEDGRQRRDFVSVYDVARACCLVLEQPDSAGGVFNVGSGRSYSISEIAERLARVVGKEYLLPELTGKYRVGDIRHCFADITLARSVLHYEPQVTLEDGLEELASWLEGQAATDRVEQASAELAARGLTV